MVSDKLLYKSKITLFDLVIFSVSSSTYKLTFEINLNSKIKRNYFSWWTVKCSNKPHRIFWNSENAIYILLISFIFLKTVSCSLIQRKKYHVFFLSITELLITNILLATHCLPSCFLGAFFSTYWFWAWSC